MNVVQTILMKYQADDSHEMPYLFFSKIRKDISKVVVCCSSCRRFTGLMVLSHNIYSDFNSYVNFNQCYKIYLRHNML